MEFAIALKVVGPMPGRQLPSVPKNVIEIMRHRQRGQMFDVRRVHAPGIQSEKLNLLGGAQPIVVRNGRQVIERVAKSGARQVNEPQPRAIVDKVSSARIVVGEAQPATPFAAWRDGRYARRPTFDQRWRQKSGVTMSRETQSKGDRVE